MSECDITCTACPIGCIITVTTEDREITDIIGYSCNRGLTYAKEEMTAPKRTLTTTVKVLVNGKKTIIAVKTNKPIPKEKMFEVMDIINEVVLTEMPNIGDIIIDNVLETESDVIVTGR